jgi:hypothetical protein
MPDDTQQPPESHPVKRGRGRPKGSRNKPKPPKPRDPSAPKFKGPVKPGEVRNPGGNGNEKSLAHVRLARHRQKLCSAVRKEFSEQRIRNCLRMLSEIAEDETNAVSDRLKAIDMMLDRALGKPKVEVEVEVNKGLSFEQRLDMARTVATLIAAKQDDGDETFDGEIVPPPLALPPAEPTTDDVDTGAVGEGPRSLHGGLPPLPAEVHSG